MLSYLIRLTYNFSIHLRNRIMGNDNDGFLFHVKDGSWGAVPVPFRVAHLKTVLLEKSFDKAVVQRIEFKKKLSSPEHEFLLCYLIEKCDSTNRTPRRSYVVVERCKDAVSDNENSATAPGPTPPTPPIRRSDTTPPRTLPDTSLNVYGPTSDISPTPPAIPSTIPKQSAPQSVAKSSKFTIQSSSDIGAVSKAVSNSSGTRAARDEFNFSPDGTVEFLEKWRAFDDIEYLDLGQTTVPFTLAMLVTLANVIHDEAVDYTLIPTQCYWFAACIYRSVASLTGVKTCIIQGKRCAGTFQGLIQVPMGINGRKPESKAWGALFEAAWAEQAKQIHEHNKNRISPEEAAMEVERVKEEAAMEVERVKEDAAKKIKAAEQKAKEMSQLYEALERAYKNSGRPIIGSSHN